MDSDDDSDTSEEEVKDSRKRSVWKRRATLTQRITSRLWEFDELDPYQIFKVSNKKCLLLRVQVLNGRDICYGFWSKFISRPSPYLILELKETPNGKRYTPVVECTCYPEWNISFQFVVDPQAMNNLHITLMSSGYIQNRTIGIVNYDITQLRRGVDKQITIEFQDASKVELVLSLVKCVRRDLRFSLSLPQEEIDFMKKRRQKIFQAMKEMLGEEDGPKTMEEVPVVAIINSGGGVRAVIASSGVFKALYESGLLGIAGYIAGLSGSSWFLTYLYTHPDFPDKSVPDKLISEIREKISKTRSEYLTWPNIFLAIKLLMQKWLDGLSVTFADIFGHMIGDMLLGERKLTKLSDMKKKLENGNVPMPLFTCIVAKQRVSARIYQEYVEFSPFEIGLPKYGTFMKTEKFGCQFYVGKIIRHYEELPLHYLIGVWGSAFSILFKRLNEDNQEMKLMLGQANYNPENKDDALRRSSNLGGYDDNFLSLAGTSSPTPSEIENDDVFVDSVADKLSPTSSEKEHDDVFEDSLVMPKSNLKTTKRRRTTVTFYIDDTEGKDNGAHTSETSLSEDSEKSSKVIDQLIKTDSTIETQADGLDQTKKEIGFKEPEIREIKDKGADITKLKISELKNIGNISSEESDTSIISYELRDHARRKTYIEDIKLSKMSLEAANDNMWNYLLQKGLTYLGQSRKGRAGAIFNPLCGLSLSHTYPISPSFEESDEDEDFQGAEEPIEAYAETLCLVDAGLAFNSPFPLLLRPQRAVDVFFSFDYSSRPADFHEAFGELILAEKWAIRNNVTFPPIQEIVEKYYNEPMREVYVFQHPYDPYCPIVVHCIIFNGLFKEYKAPNIKRETSEEFKFADFKIFSDRSNPYSSYRYNYSLLEFDRLSKLMEFNTLYGMKIFQSVLKKAVKRKRKLLSKPAPMIRLSHK